MANNPYINEQAMSKNKIIYLCEIIGGGLYALMLIGIPFLIWGIKRYKRAKKCEQYAGILLADPGRRISGIAATTGEPYGEVVANLRDLSARGLLANCYINESEDCVMLPGVEIATTQDAPDPTGLVPVICPNCNGANRLVAGAVAECEFCGTPLEAPAPIMSAPVHAQQKEVEGKKKSLADISLGEVAGAGVALLGVVKSIKK